jgi:MoaA/NifB/PqqE/SkfB family radical SAM enzyme
MCNRNINGGISNPLIKIQNWTINRFKKIINAEVLNQIDNWYCCGNFGDPILNNDLIEICKYSVDINPNISIALHTNGSARSKTWWEDLAHVLPRNHRVVFALDGLADTHSIYRIGTNFNKIIENATAFIKAGGQAEWVFIRFKHNEHQVEQARLLATELGFTKFQLKNSSRFILEPKVNVVDSTGKITHYIEPASDTPIKFIDKKIIESYKSIINESVIDCVVKREKSIYIDAYGDLFPCCWLGSVPYTYISDDTAYNVRSEMLSQHYLMVEKLGNTNAEEISIKDIIQSEAYQTVWDNYWSKEKLITCARTCGNGNFSKPTEQFVKDNNEILQ